MKICSNCTKNKVGRQIVRVKVIGYLLLPFPFDNMEYNEKAYMDRKAVAGWS
jgi:hypothetical protein